MSVADTAVAPPRSRHRDAAAATLRRTAIVVVACGIAGALVGGIGSRLVMRLGALAAPEIRGAVTENGNVVGDVTLAGTIGLMLFAGIGSAIFAAGVYTVVEPWLARSIVARGLVFGGFLLALGGSSVVDPGNADFVLLGDRALNVAMFSALFLGFGLVTSAAVASLERRVPPGAASSSRVLALAALGTLPAVAGLVVLVLGFPSLGIPIVGAWVIMLASRELDRRGFGAQARLARASATVVLVVVVSLAGADFVEGVVTIL